MEKCYLLAHGAYLSSDPLVRIEQFGEAAVRFYAVPDQYMGAQLGFAMAHLDSCGEEIFPPAGSDAVPNYYFGQLEDRHIQHVMALLNSPPLEDPEFGDLGLTWDTIQIPGVNLPGDIRMCNLDGQWCEHGMHDCTGVLGRFRRIPIDIIACRVDVSPSAQAAPHQPVGGGRDAMDPATLEVLDRWLVYLRAEYASGNPFTGEFAQWFDTLPETSRALVLTDSEVYAWRELRAAASASDGFKNAAALSSYLASQANDPTHLEFFASSVTSYSPFIQSHVGADAILGYGIHLFRTSPEAFAQHFADASPQAKAIMRRNPEIAAWSNRDELAELDKAMQAPPKARGRRNR